MALVLPRALCLYRYAEEFTQAGYIVVVFDYRYFGESGGEPRQLAATGLLRAIRGKEPKYIDSVGYPGDVAVMTSPDAVPGKDRMLEVSNVAPGRYPENVAARFSPPGCSAGGSVM